MCARTIPSVAVRALVCLVAVLAVPNVSAGTPPGQAPIADSDTSTFTSINGYGKPNQSRIWWNADAGRWDGLVPRDVGQGSDHYVAKNVAGTRVFTNVKLEDRDSARPDTYWVEAARTLYVLGSHAIESRVWRVTYNAQTDTYAVDPQVNGVAVPGLVHDAVDGDNRPATIHVSPNGFVWAAVVRNASVRVQRSTTGGASWAGSPATLGPTQVPAVASWNHFEHAGTVRVGLLVGENGTEGAFETYFYYWTLPEDDNPFLAAAWDDESSSVPASMGTETADDHVSSALDEEGNQYFAVKTEVGAPSDPRIKLLRRTPAGQWSQFLVTAAGEQPEQTRPSVVVDAENDRVHVFTTDTGAGQGRRFDAALDALGGLATVQPVIVFSSPGQEFDDLIAPRQQVDADSGLAVLVHNESTHRVWRSFASVPPEQAGRVIVAGFQSWNDVGDGPAEFVSLFNTTDAPISLAGLDIVLRSDRDGDGDVEIVWRLADRDVDLTGESIAPFSFFLVAEQDVPAPGGVHDVEVALDLPTAEGGPNERAISLEVLIDGVHMDYVVYGRHDGSNSGAHPPGDLPFDNMTFPRVEVIRSTVGNDAFREGLVERVSAAALHAGHAVPGFYVDEAALGDGFPAGIWTSPHLTSFDDYEARNSLSPAVPAACAVDTDGDTVADCLDADDDDDGVTDLVDCSPLDEANWAVHGEVTGLELTQLAGVSLLQWSAPAAPGGTALAYDVLVSDGASFAAADCLVSGSRTTQASDGSVPALHAVTFFLVRATNACGDGSLGTSSSGAPRVGPTCH